MKNLNKLEYGKKKNKETIRKCIGCGVIKPREYLIRIMKIHDTKEIVVKPSSKQFGRSFYLCYNMECLKLTTKKKKLQRLFKQEIPISVIKYLESILE